MESIRKNSAFSHQIVIHLNEGRDGSLDYVQQQGLDYTHSVGNVGVCYALNAAASLAKTDFIVFMNDDMYALPDWDRFLWDEIKEIGHERFFLSGTMIEPTDTGNDCVIAPQDFGRDLKSFREEELLGKYYQVQKEDWAGATWPPNVVHKKYWDLVGGYSVEFSPGMSSDPDFAMKLWAAGVRYFRGINQSRVYHFQAKSTGKIKKNNGNRTFLHKWGMTQSTFFKHFIRRGTPWKGPLPEARESRGLKSSLLKSRIKRFFS